MMMPQMTKANDVTERLDSLFEARYAEGLDAPGGAVLIALRDEIIYERYFGLADMATREPITADTRFNIASVSKQFTVVGLLQQDVDINSSAAQYFSFPQPFWKDITLAHLASHSSGVPDSRDRSDRMRCILATDEQSEAYFPLVESLKFAPGTDYDYLNPSFILLARVIEQLSGEDFVAYQQKHIFDPAGMAHSYYFNPAEHPANTAHGYAKTDGGWQEFDYGEETFFATRPDGGIYSTARDMLQWELALVRGKLLPAERLAMAYRQLTKVSGSQWCDYQNRPNTWYGLGWFIDKTPGRLTKVYHTGDNGGFQAYVAKYPQVGYSIIVLENRHDRDRWSMAQAIDDILFTIPER